MIPMVMVMASRDDVILKLFSLSSSFFTLFQAPLLQCYLSLRRGRTNTLFRVESSVSISSQILEHPCITANTVAHCQERIIWLRLRVPFVYGHNQRYLEDSLIMCYFSYATLFSLWAYNFPSYGLLVGFLLPWRNSILQSGPQIPHDIHITVIQVGIYCIAGWFCGS